MQFRDGGPRSLIHHLAQLPLGCTDVGQHSRHRRGLLRVRPMDPTDPNDVAPRTSRKSQPGISLLDGSGTLFNMPPCQASDID